MNFKDIVEAVVRHQIVEGLIEGWDMTKKVEASRTPVLLLCNHYGIKKTLAKQADRIIQRWVEIPQEDGFVIPPRRVGLVKRDGEVKKIPKVSRFDLPEELAKLIHCEPCAMSAEAGISLGNTWHWHDPEIQDVLMPVLHAMKRDDRDKIYPRRLATEMAYIKEALNRAWQVWHDKQCKEARNFANDRSAIHPMGNRWVRAMAVQEEHRTTDIVEHEAYLKSEYGITSEAEVGEVLANASEWLLSGKIKPDCWTQCLSWWRISKTGKTNIPLFKDAITSGWIHMLAMLGNTKMYDYALYKNRNFKQAHLELAAGIRDVDARFAKCGVLDMKAVAKPTFMPMIYGGGHAAVVEQFEDDIPDIVTNVLELKDLKTEEAMSIIDDASKAWVNQFKVKFPEAGEFMKLCREKWQDERDESGLVVPRPDGSLNLCTYFKRDKKKKVSYSHIFDAKSLDSYPVKASVFKPKFDDSGTALGAFLCQSADAWTMASAVVRAKGKILTSIHDAAGYMLADEKLVQRCYTQGFNEAHTVDVLGTGRKQLVINVDDKMLR
jgi:hypothetical protein